MGSPTRSNCFAARPVSCASKHLPHLASTVFDGPSQTSRSEDLEVVQRHCLRRLAEGKQLTKHRADTPEPNSTTSKFRPPHPAEEALPATHTNLMTQPTPRESYRLLIQKAPKQSTAQYPPESGQCLSDYEQQRLFASYPICRDPFRRNLSR